MSTGKHINLICVLAVILALVLTVLFMNGEALGIAPIVDRDSGDGPFTANDLDGDWDTSRATRITLTGDGAEISGGGAYFTGGSVYIAYAGDYVLTGTLADGSIVIDASNSGKIRLLLDGVDVHREDSAALLVEQAEKVFVTLAEGTENTLSSGAAYSDDSLDSKIDGTVYSRDDLTVNGGGSLTVTAEYSHGIVCNDDFVMTGGTVTITAAQDGVHANDSVRLCNMDLTVTAGDDGVTVSNDGNTAYFYIESGNLSIPACCEGVEAINVTVAGGKLDIVSTDDGINANGDGQSSISITGGEIRIVNDTGRDADGLDSNGSISISGGTTFISVVGSGGNCAIDYGSENGGTCQISGGTVVAAGGSMLAEGFDSSSPQGFLMESVSGGAGAAVVLKADGGEVLLEEEIPCVFTSLLLSTPALAVDGVCTLSVDGQEQEIVIDNASSVPAGMGGMFGGQGGRPGGNRPDGDMPDGFTPGQFPDGKTPDGQLRDDFPGGEIPDGFPGGQTPGQGGGMAGTDRNPFLQAENGANESQSAVTPAALGLVGLSFLVLLGGLLAAVKTKH